MGKIIAVANQKGGVGKTTTCVNLTCALKKRGRRVLLVDCDPQGNSTSGMGVDKTATPNCYDMLMNGAAAADCIRSTKYGDVLPANMNLSGCSVELVSSEQREYIMKTALAAVQDDYDFILIDCPPSLELLTINALVAADSVLIPVQCEYYALEGIADLMRSIKMCNKRLNPELTVQGIVMTMYDGRTKLSDQVVNEVRKFFGKKVYKTMIPRNVRLSEAPSHRKPAIAYDKESKGARAYLHLAGELIKREEKAAKAVDVCYKMLGTAIEKRLENAEKKENKGSKEYIAAAVAYIDEHLDNEDLSIVSVATHVYLNPVYFGRVFKNTFHMTFKQYLLQRRMELAKRLLEDGRTSIGNICEQVGISNPSYFSHLFKEYTGQLPRDYKREYEV